MLEGTVVYIGNTTIANVVGVSSGVPVFAFGKKLTLTNVYYASKVKKNLCLVGYLWALTCN